MTRVVLATLTVIAAGTLVGVLWSLLRTMRIETEMTRLLRDGARTSGTVVDNAMSATAQRRLVFSPVVEFRSQAGRTVQAVAAQQAATSWPRGTTVEVAYDPANPEDFVLASARPRGTRTGNAVVAVLVLGIIAGSMVAMYHAWWQFRYDRSDPPPAGIQAPQAPGP